MMKRPPKITTPVRLAILFLIQGALTVSSFSLFRLYLLLLGGLVALIAAYFAVDCKTDCVKWWLLLLPGQYIANMLTLYFYGGIYDDPYPAIVLFYLAAQSAGVGLRKLRMRYRLTKKDFEELDNPEESEDLPQKQPEPPLHPDFLRLELISCLQALFVPHVAFLSILVGFIVAEFMGEFLGMVLLFAVSFGIPLLLGIFAVGSVKWWLISLPIQLLMDVGMQYTKSMVQSTPLIKKIELALFFLAIQAAGVGIRLLVRKWRAR